MQGDSFTDMRHSKVDSPHLILSLIPISGGLIGVLINIMTRLTRIETDVKWIKKVINDGTFFYPPGEK